MGVLQNHFTNNLYFEKMRESQKWSTKSSNEHRFEIYAHYQHHWTSHLESYPKLTFGKHWGLATKLFQHLLQLHDKGNWRPLHQIHKEKVNHRTKRRVYTREVRIRGTSTSSRLIWRCRVCEVTKRTAQTKMPAKFANWIQNSPVVYSPLMKIPSISFHFNLVWIPIFSNFEKPNENPTLMLAMLCTYL